MTLAMDLMEKARRYEDYLRALEDERRKIQVFQRELPLCLQLVSQTIENVRSQIESMTSEETVSDGPVLEEFIPLKPSLSSTSDEGNSANEVKQSLNLGLDRSEMKTDWMQSVQLWNQGSDPSPPPVVEAPYKPVARKTGAFHPFEKEKHYASPTPLPASSTCATSSTAGAISEEKKQNKENDKEKKEKQKEKEEEESQSQRKSRRCWSPELHRRFLHALQQLGGSHVATPKQIRELMKVDGLTNDEVKSHLQKYRLHTRRPNSVQNTTNNNNQTPQFVVVGGIWVPSGDYSSATITTATTVSGRSPTLYTPVASVPSPQKQNVNSLSVNRQTGDADAGNKSAFASPSNSSSSQTTTASPF